MARPSVLTYLSPGKLIDTFKGFVDTFNYIVDFVENLRGDGDDDDDKAITIDRSVPDRPVIRCSASGGGTPPDDASIWERDNKLEIYAFYDADADSVPVKNADGVIEWKPYGGGGGSAEVDEVSVTKSEPGYTDKIAVKGHVAATQDQVFSKGASAPGWAYPTIAAQGTSGDAQRGQTVKIAAGTYTNLTATASKSGNVVTIAITVKYV